MPHRHPNIRMLVAMLTLALLMPLLGPGVPSAHAQDKPTVRISIFSWPGYGFWFIAREKGLAPDLNLDIQIIEDPYQSFALMKAGQLDVTSSTIEYGPLAAASGNPARIVTFANLSYGTDKIIVAPGIEQISDLKGRRVAVMEGGLAQIYMGIYLEQQGLKFDDVEYVNLIMADAMAAMISGRVAAGEFWEPFGSQVLERLPEARIVSHSQTPYWLKTALLADTCYMHADFIRERPEVATRTLAALYAGIDYWMKHPAEGNQIIADALGFELADVESVIGTEGKSHDGGLYIYSLKEAAQFVGVAEGDPPFGQTNGQIRDHFKLTNEWWQRFGLVEQMYPVEAAVDTSVIEKVWQMHQP